MTLAAASRGSVNPRARGGRVRLAAAQHAGTRRRARALMRCDHRKLFVEKLTFHFKINDDNGSTIIIVVVIVIIMADIIVIIL